MNRLGQVKRNFLRLSEFTLAGLIQYVFLKIFRKELIVKGACNCCGNCCRAINLEGPKGWIKSEEYFNSLLTKNPEFKRFAVIKQDSTGFLVFRCKKLGENNLCSDYKNRPSVCNGFPDKRLPFCGGGLPSGCGYRFEEVKSFKHILKKKISNNR